MEDRKLKLFAKSLMKKAPQAMLHAERETLNRAAFSTMRLARANVEETFTLRNKWMKGSVRADPIKSVRPLAMRAGAATGSTEQGMADQELGTVLRGSGKHGHPVPTPVASGESEGVRPRKKVRMRPRRLRKISLKPSPRGTNRGHTNKLAVMDAVANKQRFVALTTKRGRGIFRISSFAKGKARPRLMYSLERKEHRIPKRPWLKPAADVIVRGMAGIYRRALQDQLVRRAAWAAKRRG